LSIQADRIIEKIRTEIKTQEIDELEVVIYKLIKLNEDLMEELRSKVEFTQSLLEGIRKRG